jgi:DNA-binding CsgD family transcriptional regulator
MLQNFNPKTMNTALTYYDLPTTEQQVADLYAWGMTAKEIANIRKKSIHTVKNQIRVLFFKTGTRKDTEFASWYFCSRFAISFDLSPLKKGIISACLLAIIGFNLCFEINMIRVTRSARVRVEQVARTQRKNETV